MAERLVIAAAPRTVVGKSVAKLRRNGILPANVYGRGIESRSIEIDAREFGRNVKAAGLRGMFELNVTGETDPRYVIIRGMMRKGGTGDPIHVDFFQVDPTRPIQANVPVRLVGEAPAVRDLAGRCSRAGPDFGHCLPRPSRTRSEADAGLLKGST
jgi:large subunit ribosomal protein L25